jgi:hypothetical protein
MRGSACPMKICGMGILVISDAYQALDSIVILQGKSIYFNIFRYFIPVNMPTVGFLEFFQVSAAFRVCESFSVNRDLKGLL